MSCVTAVRGQWAVGHFTPLNGNEQFKKDDDGLNVRTRIETIYSKRGFDSIDPNDLRGRMRWWGCTPSASPGSTAARPRSWSRRELDDRYFMLRVRVDGGALTTRQLRVIGEISQEFARGTADITDRQNVQYHWIRIEDVPEIWDRLESVGLSTVTACGDTPRVMIGSPGGGHRRGRDHRRHARAGGDEAPRPEQQGVLNLPASSRRPSRARRCWTWCTRSTTSRSSAYATPSTARASTSGWGGGLSTNPKLGVRLGAWVPIDEVPDVYEGVISIFRDYGYRRLRNRARLKFLVADWGAEKFRQVLEDEYLGGRKLIDGPAPEQPVQQWRDHIGVHRQKDGRFYVGFAPRVGRVDGATLTKVADLAEAHGSGRVRTTVEQKMIILDVAEDKVDLLVEGAWRRWTSPPGRPRSGAAPWPAPASSSASSPSWRPSSAARS